MVKTILVVGAGLMGLGSPKWPLELGIMWFWWIGQRKIWNEEDDESKRALPRW
jgi:hypothetical protein